MVSSLLHNRESTVEVRLSSPSCTMHDRVHAFASHLNDRLVLRDVLEACLSLLRVVGDYIEIHLKILPEIRLIEYG